MGCCCCFRCGSKSGCRCCCGGKRGATITFGLLGLLLAAAVIAPPVYIYKTDQEYHKMFPIFKLGRKWLAIAAGGDPEPVLNLETTTVSVAVSDDEVVQDTATVKDLDEIEDQQDSHAKTYKLAIFQLLDDIEDKAPQLALFSFCMGCLNVPLHLMLLTGAIFKKSYFLVPWLVIALVEHLVIGVPLIVFFGLISLYLASQLQLYIPAGLMIGTVVSAFFISLSSWFTVYRCHNNFKKGSDYEGYANSTDGQLTQPLLGSGPIPPPLPPNHPAATSGSNGYQLGQYPQYYPPHGGNSRALPTAPHPGGIYPSLANA